MARKVSQAAIPSPDDVVAAENQIVELNKRIEFYITEYSIEILAQKTANGEYVVPDYQRAFVWEYERKSRFIESVLLGLPIPFLFFWEMPDGKLEIVDGSQRLRTIEEFVLGDLRLGELEQLTNVSGFKFSELPKSRQRKVLNRSIRGIVLNEDADEAARLDMFDRINTGSKRANMAEIRRGALAGPFMSLVVDLAKMPLFVELSPISDKREREREREELVTRFFAYGDGLQGYKDRPADFIYGYVKRANEAFRDDPSLAESYKQRFIDVLGFVKRAFPFGFAKTATGRATPRARFESIAIGSYWAIRDNPKLLEREISTLRLPEWLDGDEFSKITRSDSANVRSKLEGRIEFVRQMLVSK